MTGAGRAYCAGADLGAGGATFDYAKRADRLDQGSPIGEDGQVDYSHPGVRDGGGRLTLRIFNCRKPVIGAINGPAVGIGATMTLPMDFRLASDTAKFGFVFARRGIVPEAASSWFLPRIVGMSRALEWSMSGRIFDAGEALAAGLVTSLDEGLVAAGLAIADRIDEAMASGEGQEITKALYLVPHMMNVLKEALATPAARRAAGVTHHDEETGKGARLRGLRGGAAGKTAS